jgi:hypothetical protein
MRFLLIFVLAFSCGTTNNTKSDSHPLQPQYGDDLAFYSQELPLPQIPAYIADSDRRARLTGATSSRTAFSTLKTGDFIWKSCPNDKSWENWRTAVLPS